VWPLTYPSRELLLVEGVAQQGLGNWQAVAEHVGTRTREEVEEHYNTVYIDSPNWPRPVRFFFLSAWFLLICVKHLAHGPIF
jgi:hypothetical protein